MLVSLSQTSISSPDHKESPTIYPNPLSTENWKDTWTNICQLSEKCCLHSHESWKCLYLTLRYD